MIFAAESESASAVRPTALYRAVAAVSAANDWTAVNGLAAARVYTTVEAEYDALKNAAAAVDLGVFQRYTVRGLDAAPLLGRLTSAPVRDLNVGESGRGLILDTDGMVVDVCDVSRLSGDLFMLTTSSPCDRRLQLAARGFAALVENITSTIAALGVFGPEAGRVVSAAGFEAGSDALASQGRVRGVETFVRPAALGSAPGFELIFPADEALTLWERVRRAGAPVPTGLGACEIARIEGGAPRQGVDYQNADRAEPAARRLPQEIGLPHLAPLNRAWFNGRRALAAARSRRRLAALSIDADELADDARIVTGDDRKERTLARVTSAAYSPHLRAVICLAEFSESPRDGAREAPMRVAAPAGGGPQARFLETHESRLAAAFIARESKTTESKGLFV